MPNDLIDKILEALHAFEAGAAPDSPAAKKASPPVPTTEAPLPAISMTTEPALQQSLSITGEPHLPYQPVVSENDDVFKYHAFFTHDWGWFEKDGQSVSSHQRVIKIAQEVRKRTQIQIWLDENQMTAANVVHKMTEGIDQSACVVAFITSRYIDKVKGLGQKKENDK